MIFELIYDERRNLWEMALERFDDSVFEGDEDVPSILARPCELPSTARRRSPFGEEERFHEDCQICFASGSRTVVRFEELLSTQAQNLPEEDACVLMAKVFNRTCYEADRRSDDPIGIRPMEPGDVLAHMRATIHLRRHSTRLIDDGIRSMIEVGRQIEKSGLWENGARDEAVLNKDGFDAWCKVNENVRKSVQLREKIFEVSTKNSRSDRKNPRIANGSI